MYAMISALPLSRMLPRLSLPPLARWRRIRRERLQLLELSDYMLSDIGITREEAGREAARPFWDVPR
jgi:uncharacterized protein YjiS (DUF1127 family)